MLHQALAIPQEKDREKYGVIAVVFGHKKKRKISQKSHHRLRARRKQIHLVDDMPPPRFSPKNCKKQPRFSGIFFLKRIFCRECFFCTVIISHPIRISPRFKSFSRLHTQHLFGNMPAPRFLLNHGK